jgi:hypothetical protein
VKDATLKNTEGRLNGPEVDKPVGNRLCIRGVRTALRHIARDRDWSSRGAQPTLSQVRPYYRDRRLTAAAFQRLPRVIAGAP